MDSFVDMDLMNLNGQSIDMVSTLIVDSAVSTHETEADLASYRAEFAELQAELASLKTRKKALEENIEQSKLFTERAIAYQSAGTLPPPPPKAPGGGSKWGILKTSILAKPDAVKEFPAPGVHVPVHPAFAKFFYLVEKLELARRTSKFVGIRSKAPRAEYVEKCALLRRVVMDAAVESAADLSCDIAVLAKINADAARTTLSILAQQPETREHSFDDLFTPHSKALSAQCSSVLHVVPASPQRPPAPSVASPVRGPPPPPPTAPTAPAAPTHRASVSFAPFPSSPSSHALPPPPPPVMMSSKQAMMTAVEKTSEDQVQSTGRRGSILQSFRSHSNSFAASKNDLERNLDPAVLAFQQRATEIVSRLPTAAELQRGAQRRHSLHADSENSRPFGTSAEAMGEYKEALQAHSMETLDSFHYEMEAKMRDCLLLCKQALARRCGPLAVMKGTKIDNYRCLVHAKVLAFICISGVLAVLQMARTNVVVLFFTAMPALCFLSYIRDALVPMYVPKHTFHIHRRRRGVCGAHSGGTGQDKRAQGPAAVLLQAPTGNLLWFLVQIFCM